MKDSDRRKYPRKDWQSSIEFCIINPDLPANNGNFLSGVTVNMSAGGICIETYYPLQRGQMVRLGPDDVAGIVQWSRKLDHTYRIGIKFI